MLEPLTTGASAQKMAKNQSSMHSTYAQMAQSSQFPTKEQAVVLDAVDGVSIKDYTLEIGKIVNPANIRFVSRISQARVCFYFDSKATADKLTNNITKIKINGQELEIRPLVSKMKRIILSNVCPAMPHYVIIDDLKNECDIQTTSQMSFIRAGMNDAGFSHILSFRRQIYLHPDDVKKLPPSLQVVYDNTPYWIYLSTEKVTCFVCNEEGHLAKYCKQTDTQQASSSQQSQLASPVKVNNSLTSSEAVNELPSVDNSTKVIKNYAQFTKPLSPTLHDKLNDTLTPAKRALSESTSSSNVNAEEDASWTLQTSKNNSKHTAKKYKNNSSKEFSIDLIKSQLIPAKDLIEANAGKYPINFDDIASLLFSTYNNPNVLKVTSYYSTDNASLITMLIEIKEIITERKLKSRIDRILKKLQDSEANEDSLSESAASTFEE